MLQCPQFYQQRVEHDDGVALVRTAYGVEVGHVLLWQTLPLETLVNNGLNSVSFVACVIRQAANRNDLSTLWETILWFVLRLLDTYKHRYLARFSRL